MTLIETPSYVARIECDKPTCSARITPYRPDLVRYGREVGAMLAVHDWSVWASRSRRYYCPDHTPGPQTKMRRVQ